MPTIATQRGLNSRTQLEILPTGKALRAEVRGPDFSKPVLDNVAETLRQAWSEHMVLPFRRQSISDAA